MTNKALVFVFLLLVLLYVIGTQYFLGESDVAFEGELVTLDHQKITTISLEDTNTGYLLTLKKENESWIISQDNVNLVAMPDRVLQLILKIDTIQSLDILISDKKDWPRLGVDKAKTTRIKAFEHTSLVADFFVGNLAQHKDTISKNLPFFHFYDDDEVYLIDESKLIREELKLNFYRDNHFWALSRLQQDTFMIQYLLPDTSFFIKNEPNGWLINNSYQMDPDSMNTFLEGIRYIAGLDFVDDFDELDTIGIPRYELYFRRLDSAVLGRITMFAGYKGRWPFIFNSSQNTKHFLGSDSTGVYKRIFPALDSMVRKSKKVN